jgi:hypothetical protein
MEAAVAQLRAAAAEVVAASAAGGGAAPVMATAGDHGTALLVELRRLHRAATADARQTRAGTAETKADMDRRQLRLQNLQYERRHLLNQIHACRDVPCVNAHAALYDAGGGALTWRGHAGHCTRRSI